MSVAKKQREEEETATVPPAHICEKGRTIFVSLMINGIPEDELQIDLERIQTPHVFIKTEHEGPDNYRPRRLPDS